MNRMGHPPPPSFGFSDLNGTPTFITIRLQQKIFSRDRKFRTIVRLNNRGPIMQLTRFEKIIKLAEERKGGKAALEKMLASHKPLSAKQLAKVPDDRYLSMMTSCIFKAGFNWKVVENK